MKNPANVDLSTLEPHINGMYDYFDQKLGFQKPPTIVFDSDPSNQPNVLGKTAYYDPQSLEIHIFSDGRHPKDMLRSIAHELIHHQQNMEGRLDVGGYSGPGYYLENDKLRVVEHEAMLEGNKLMREYEDTIKKESKDMSLKEWKNNELNQRLMKKFGILKESQELEELSNNANHTDRHRGNNQDGRLREDEDVVEEAQEEVEEGQSVRQGTEDRDVGRDRQRADRMHEDEELDEAHCGKRDDELEEGAKPDFLDLDKDGDKEESMEDAAEDAKAKNEIRPYKENKITVDKNLAETIQKALKISKGK
tara:strand:- start:525 stop:1445 length:921 start_codon:yes stop_codon:yes gene_type:complete